MIFSKEISALKAQITGLEGQVSALTDANIALVSDHATAIENLNSAHAAAIEAKDLRIQELETAAAAEETRVAGEVTKRLADAGVAPVARVDTPSDAKTDAPTVGRANTTWARPF